MGEVRRRPAKPLQVNPLMLSQPMGATLAFLGVDRCMPLMHGAQGCTSFTKVYLTRHFCEPIAIQTTAVTDVTAILDGGDYNIVESVKNVSAKVNPDLIGLYTTGLTETKGDDIRGVAGKIEHPLVWVNTPDYEGGLESGWALATKAMIEQLTAPAAASDPRKVVLLPHVSLTPIEVEKLREFIAAFGFEVVALPDLSTALDGHLGEKQSALSSGGIAVAEIHALGDAGLALSVGDSMRRCGAALAKKNPAMQHRHFPHLQGLEATDGLVAALLELSGRTEPPAGVARWRRRLQDVLLDGHFALGQTRFLVATEPDQAAGLCAALAEAGGKVAAAVSPVDAPLLETLPAERAWVGDLEDAEDLAADWDLILGGTHTENLAHRLHKGVLVRGFPDWEQVGSQLRCDLLYEGGCHFLCAAANAAERSRHHAADGHGTPSQGRSA